MNRKSFFTTAILAILLLACSGDPGTGPSDVKWDRVTCERCRMVLSDRHHSAQVRYTPEGRKRSTILYFDDIGCALLWLQDKPWRDDAETELWVTDHRNGKWIDARSATYVRGHITPMEYGLGAQSDPAPDGLDVTQAKKHIAQVEERFNIHGVQLQDRLKELAAKRAAAGKAKPNHSWDK